MNTDDLRTALRARTKGGYLQRLARQLNETGVPVTLGALESFATGNSMLPPAALSAIVHDIFGPHVSWDAATGATVRHAREAIPLGTPPDRFDPKNKEVATNEHGRIWPGLAAQLKEQERLHWARAKALARGAR
jgi:hypothetical protein